MPATPAAARRTPGLPKYLWIKQALTKRLHTMQADEPLPSMAELRAEFGVALGTMDRALRELRRDGLIDIRHGSGIYGTGRRETQQLGICFGFDILEPEAGVYPRLLLQGLTQHEAADPSILCRHYFAAGSGQYWATRLDLLQRDVQANLVDAVIVVGIYFGELRDLPVPIVGMNALPDTGAQVHLDINDLVRQGVRALADRGCRRLAFAGGHRAQLPAQSDPTYAVQREHQLAEQEFRREVRRLGLETADPWILGTEHPLGEFSGSSTVTAAGHAHAATFLTDPDHRPDGIVSTDDYRSVGLCHELTARGLTVGSDIHIATHANRGSAVLAGLPLIRLEFDPSRVAHALITAATGLISGDSPQPGGTTVKPTVILP